MFLFLPTFGLSNVHPEARQVHAMQLSVRGHVREHLALNRSRLDLNTVQDAGIEDVDASIDAISDELFRLLDEAIDSRLSGQGQDNTIFARLLDFRDLDRPMPIRKISAVRT